LRCWQRKVWDHKTLAEERGPRKDAGPLLNSALAKISVRRQDGQRAALGLLVDALNSVRTMNRWNEVAIDSPLYSRTTSVCPSCSGSAIASWACSTCHPPEGPHVLLCFHFSLECFSTLQFSNSVSHETLQRVDMLIL
jgi:hypothetical protein